MAHFAVVAPAFYSHFNSLSQLALALIERGHHVTFIHRPDAAVYVRDACIGFHAVGAATHPEGSLGESLQRAANPGSPLGLRRVILDMADSTAMLCRELPAALRRLEVDYLIADQMEAAGGLVAEGIDMPFVSVACALPVNREPGIPLPVMPFVYEDSERARKMVEGSTLVYDWMMGPHRRVISEQAQAFGLSPRDNLHQCLSPLAQISQTVAGFDFPRRALPPHFHHVGPLNGGADAPNHAGLPPIDHDRPFVFASLGTLQGQRYGLFRRIAHACRQLDVQLLIAHCGGLDERQARALERIGSTRVCAFAPQLEVLKRANAIVSHGGSNTVMEAIAAGVPILALPVAFDQPGAAARIEYAGIGLRASARVSTTGRIRDQLCELLDKPIFAKRMAPLADEIRQAGGVARAADIVEQVFGFQSLMASHG